MGAQSRTVDSVLAGIAKGQNGNVARRQALAAGVSRRSIRRRIDNGSLYVCFPGIYRVGHRAPGLLAHYHGAVLACGEGALLCGLAAAYLLGLTKGRPPMPAVLCRTERRIRGIRTHRCRDLASREATEVEGIPCLSVAEVLVELAADLTDEALGKACHTAGVLYKTNPGHVEAVLKRRPNAPGAPRLRRVMGGDTHVVLSRLERRFLTLLRKHGLPLPVTNRVAGSFYVDCRWPQFGLTVELDSYAFHNSRHSWEQGYRREREARGRGDEFRRYTWTDVVEEPRLMLAELRTLLANRPA